MQKYINQNSFSSEAWGVLGNKNAVNQSERILSMCYTDMNHTIAEIRGFKNLV